jgi:hypothetical protein
VPFAQPAAVAVVAAPFAQLAAMAVSFA